MDTTIFALTLAAAPTSDMPRVPLDVADVEVVSEDDSSHLVTYDAEGEVSANIMIWAEPSGVIHLDADFADGRYLFATIDRDDVMIDSKDPVEAAAHMEAIKEFLASEPNTQERSWTECAGKTLVAGGGCATGIAVVCVGLTFLAVCECLPLLSSGEAECY